MNLALMIISPFIPVLVLYILDKKFKLKLELIKQFKTIGKYRFTIFAISFICFLSYMLFTVENNISINPLAFSILFLYHYLIRIPEELD